MKDKISACLICKNEPLLEKCILSIRDYVDDLVIIDTGSTDKTTIEVAKKYADTFEIFLDCNDAQTGLIEDFSLARNYSLSKAKNDWVLWLDADDIIQGADRLHNLIKNIPKNDNEVNMYLFPYEYSYDNEGNVTCLHYRERLFSNKNKVNFVNPVHEVAVAINGITPNFFIDDNILYKHMRQFGTKPIETGRNLRILRKYFEKHGDSDPRQLYYLGLECYNSGLIDEAESTLIKYIDKSAWSDEIVMALLKLGDIYMERKNYKNVINCGLKILTFKENWSEGYFLLGKAYYFLAQTIDSEERRNWERCAFFIKAGLNFPPTKTLLFINPLERNIEIHRYLNMALNKIGDVAGALESVNTALSNSPNDQAFLSNKKIYEQFLSKSKVNIALNELMEKKLIDRKSYDMIFGVLNNLTNIVDEDEKLNQSKEEINFIKNMEKTNSPFPIAGISQDAKWNIPESYDFQSHPIKMTNDQLQAVVIMMWKQFMLHDEILSAISFLENAPYNVRHSFATQKALKLTKDCLEWMDNKDDFQKINAPANPEVEAGNALPNKLVLSEGHRFDLIANNLAPNSTIVDFGSMDGCFTNRFGLLGHKPTGLDVCESSVKLARKKAIEFNTGAEYVCTYFKDAVNKVKNNYFDYATSTDTYEHIKDPVNDMFIPAKKMLKADGKFLLATPHGAWMRGQYVKWAHPWLWEPENSWLQASPRAHIVAPTVWTLAAQFREAGYWVKDCYPDLCDNTHDLLSKEIIDQGNLFAEAHLKSPVSDKSLDIIFFAGDGIEEWTPKTVEKFGTGGSEFMLLNQAKNLSLLGHKVRVYNSCGPNGEGIYDGVEYHSTNKFQDLKCDVLIISRRADMLGDQYNISAKLKLLWVHDMYAISATNELLLKADKILALTEWHKQNLINSHNISEDHIIVTRNGINLDLFNKEIKRDQFKCVNASSPDRSWPILLANWPRIKKQVPEATLHLFYGFLNWEFMAKYDQLQLDLINRLKQQIKDLEPLDVVYHDRVNQEILANEFMSASAMIYPTFFMESSCINAMSSQAAGLKIISSSIAALNETVGERGVLIDGIWTDQSYQDQFVEEVIKALKNTDDSEREKLKEYAKNNFGLKELAKSWENMFYNLIFISKSNPIVKYQPTVPYRNTNAGYMNGDTRIIK